MLEIIANGERLNIDSSTSVSLTMENPLMSTDKVPVTYTLNFELPCSPRNLQLLGHPERVASLLGFKKQPAKILFSGLTMATGELKVEEVQTSITVQFVGAEIPDGIRKPLYKLDFGSIALGQYFPDGSGSKLDLYGFNAAGINYNEFLTDNLINADANIIAAPMSIGGAEWIPLDEGQTEADSADPYINQRLHFINAYQYSDRWSSYGYILDEFEPGQLSKILPSFRVGWMFDKIFNGQCNTNNVFNNQWKQLMLVSLWHPKYQTKDKNGVWDIVNGQITVRYADFMPDIPANEFVAEMLKIACASLYMKGDRCIIEQNEDILNRTVFKDWNDKLMGDPTISVEPAGKYNFGYSSGDEGEVPVERVVTPVNSIYMMQTNAEYQDGTQKTYYVSTTNQTFENIFDDTTINPCRYTLIKQDLGTKSEDEDYQDDDINEFDVSTNVAILKTVPARYIAKDNDPMENTYENRTFYYIPLIDKISDKRPDNITVGLWKGISTVVSGGSYPYLSHCNYNALGRELDDVTLQLTGATLAQHTSFKAWVEKDKQILKAEMNLTPFDLNQLDLRDKIYILGRYFYIRSIEFTLTANRLEPADVHFIEA